MGQCNHDMMLQVHYLGFSFFSYFTFVVILCHLNFASMLSEIIVRFSYSSIKLEVVTWKLK